jgi:hypothetical protein
VEVECEAGGDKGQQKHHDAQVARHASTFVPMARPTGAAAVGSLPADRVAGTLPLSVHMCPERSLSVHLPTLAAVTRLDSPGDGRRRGEATDGAGSRRVPARLCPDVAPLPYGEARRDRAACSRVCGTLPALPESRPRRLAQT